MEPSLVVRAVEADEDELVALIATRMRQTLEEVLDPERAQSMYSMDWLIARVRQHLPGGELDGAVFVAERAEVDGHIILRRDQDEVGSFALISTIFVDPGARRGGIASALVDRAEAWTLAQELRRTRTYTSAHNAKLIALLEHRGYRVVLQKPSVEMVGLECALGG